MKRLSLSVTATLGALSLCACAGLADYVTPTLQADNAAVAAATVTVNNDVLQAKADYDADKAALPGDAVKMAADQAVLRAAFATLVADLKAAGQPPPATPSAVTAAAPPT
jgi:hypothetical protein